MIETVACDISELRTLFLFEKLTDEQLTWLCEHGRVEHYDAGPVVTEGDPATCFFVLVEGKIAMSRRIGADDVEVNRTDHRGVYFGAWSAYLGERAPKGYTATVRAIVPSRFYVLDAADFTLLMQQWFPMALHLLEGLFFGNQRTQTTVAQRERLLALGSLSAGLTHELNNPAAAAVRATVSLRDRVAHMRDKLGKIAGGAWDRNALEALIDMQQRAAEQVAKAPELSPLEASDREDELADWFDDHDIRGGYELAPTFVAAGIESSWLDRVAATVEDDVLEGAVRWLNYTIETELLMNEIEDSTNRISTLVAAAKQYSQMDRAPHQVLDVHELIESTLIMLSRKIGDGVQVVKHYDRTLPDVPVYGAELNQVWTNLIDNALQAMGGEGTLTITTRRVHDSIEVEFADTGPGIPEENVSRIFEPFFTTKPVGEGTGLGLDISWRIVVNKHHGDLSVTSQPGDTRFRVRLPISGQEDAG
ncbi:MAG TPA: ATP-binding protein [Jatrophihabitans sp.]|nr:ATP-binding protein [Jatrophihabitans sp.]